MKFNFLFILSFKLIIPNKETYANKDNNEIIRNGVYTKERIVGTIKDSTNNKGMK